MAELVGKHQHVHVDLVTGKENSVSVRGSVVFVSACDTGDTQRGHEFFSFFFFFFYLST